jgi:hypothetical protein
MSDPENPAAVRDLDASLAHLVQESELTDVRFDRFSGEVLSSGMPQPVSQLDLAITTSHRIHGEGFDCRYEARAPLRADDESTVAELNIAVVLSFTHTDDVPADKDAVSAFMDQVAYFVAMPFIREGIQSLSVRLGLDALTLGMLGEGKDSPTTATQRVPPRRAKGRA